MSGTMAWMRNRDRAFGSAMLELVDALRKQIGKEPQTVEASSEDDE